jgi:hypothetical protein
VDLQAVLKLDAFEMAAGIALSLGAQLFIGFAFRGADLLGHGDLDLDHQVASVAFGVFPAFAPQAEGLARSNPGRDI